MRKFTISLLLAAVALPAMASAQEEGGRQWRQQEDSDKSGNRPSGEERQRQNEQRQQAQAERQTQNQQAQSERQAQMQQMQAQRQQQGQQQAQQQNDRQAQYQQMQAARQAQLQQQQQQQGDRQAQYQQMQAARQAQLEQRQQQQQARRQARADQQDGERTRAFGGRGSREADGSARDEQMQQYRAEMEQRRAQAGGQQYPGAGGAPVGREGRYRGVPDINPNTVGRPTPENREARYANRDRNPYSGNQWTSAWRNNNRYDWRHYRDQHRSTFRIGFYYDPFGYSYNRFGIGSYMYPGYYQSNYWINDPWQYRLPPAYGPYRWVRYHNDALMIDTWTGEVVDVIYGFFW